MQLCINLALVAFLFAPKPLPPQAPTYNQMMQLSSLS